MSTDTASKLRDAFVAMFAPDMASTAQTLVDAMLNQGIEYHTERVSDVAVGASEGSTALLGNTVHLLDQGTGLQFRVTSFKVALQSNLAVANTNQATISLVYNNGAGGADTIIASGNTAPSNNGGLIATQFTLEQPVSVPINATNALIPVGSVLAIRVVKSGTGVNVPHAIFDVRGTLKGA